jgi:hypothetical protein
MQSDDASDTGANESVFCSADGRAPRLGGGGWWADEEDDEDDDEEDDDAAEAAVMRVFDEEG